MKADMTTPGWLRRPSSLSARLTLLFSATTAFLLLASAGSLYWLLQRNLTEQGQHILSDKLTVLGLILREQPGQTEPLREEVQWEAGSRRFTRYYSRVLDPSGEILLETQGMSERLRGAPFPAPAAGMGDPQRPLIWRAESERTYLLGSAWAREGGSGGPVRQLQVAVDVSDASDLSWRTIGGTWPFPSPWAWRWPH